MFVTSVYTSYCHTAQEAQAPESEPAVAGCEPQDSVPVAAAADKVDPAAPRSYAGKVWHYVSDAAFSLLS